MAALWASEAAIYGRFGYGVATTGVALTVERGDGRGSRCPTRRCGRASSR